MAFLKRVFSTDYRRGLAAEAAGDWLGAARAYALAGEREKVAEMHLLAALRAPAGGRSRLDGLRSAARWADGEGDSAQAIRRRVAAALLEHAQAGGLGTESASERDRALAREAAALLAGAGDLVGAGRCHELLGDEAAAADAYQRAGEVERLEAVLERDERRRREAARRRELDEESRLRLASGERDRALAALREAAALDPAGDAAERAARLERRLLVDGRVTLRVDDGAPVVHLGRFPFTLGREAGCDVVLRDGDVSRLHASIDEREGRFTIRDCRSKHGLRLDGVPLDGELPLPGDGELGLGPGCALAFRVAGGALSLHALRGVDRGLEAIASRAPQPIAGGLATLAFVEGRPLLSAAPGRSLRIAGARAAATVQLVRDDEVEIVGDGARAVRVTAA